MAQTLPLRSSLANRKISDFLAFHLRWICGHKAEVTLHITCVSVPHSSCWRGYLSTNLPSWMAFWMTHFCKVSWRGCGTGTGEDAVTADSFPLSLAITTCRAMVHLYPNQTQGGYCGWLCYSHPTLLSSDLWPSYDFLLCRCPFASQCIVLEQL